MILQLLPVLFFSAVITVYLLLGYQEITHFCTVLDDIWIKILIVGLNEDTFGC